MSDYLGKEFKKLGFGMMRLPKFEDGSFDEEQIKQMVDAFLEAGFTYFDTAFVYTGSEEVTKRALVDRYPRDRYTLATKMNAMMMANNAEEAKKEFEISLERTGAGYFDFYLLHALSEDNVHLYDDYGLWDFVKEKKEEGLIKHIGFSFHGKPPLLEELLEKHPEVEFVQLQINYADWEDEHVCSRKNAELVKKYNKGLVIMEPVKGGTLANPLPTVQDLMKEYNPDASPASWAIRFAASCDNVMAVLSGMSTLEQMQDNISYMKDFQPLNEEEKNIINKIQEIMKTVDSIPCTGCKYCVDGCPMNIMIPGILAARNKKIIFNADDRAKLEYDRAITDHGKASECIQCGQCESVCPQGINIITQLEKAAEYFGE